MSYVIELARQIIIEKYEEFYNIPQMAYILMGLILMLWRFDHLLLIKVERWIYSYFKRMVWTALKLYTEYKDRNEMIKLGYHVDSVFLHEFHSSSYVRRIDVLRIFREEIQNELFTSKKNVDVWEFLELCTEENSNFSKIDKGLYYELEVNYTIDMKRHKIIFTTQEDVNHFIRFPIYKENVIRERDITENGILSAIIVKDPDHDEGIDIKETIDKFAGPMENFYSDSEFIVKRKWLSYDSVSEDDLIKITDFNGMEHIFKPSDDFLCVD